MNKYTEDPVVVNCGTSKVMCYQFSSYELELSVVSGQLHFGHIDCNWALGNASPTGGAANGEWDYKIQSFVPFL